MKANGAAGPAAARLEASRAAIGRRLGQPADDGAGKDPEGPPRAPRPPHAVHAARLAWTVARSAAQATLEPIAARHPWALVGSAVLAGGLLVALRPWQRLRVSPLLLTMATQIAWQTLAARTASPRASRSAPAGPRADIDDGQGA